MLLFAGAIGGFVLHARLVHEFDRALEAKARALIAVTSREGRRVDIDFRSESMPEFAKEEADDIEVQQDKEENNEEEETGYFEIFLQDGTVIRRSPSLERDDLPLRLDSSKEAAFRNVKLPDGRRGRLVQIAFEPRVEPLKTEVQEPLDEDQVELPASVDEQSLRLLLVVARDRERLDALLNSVYLTLAALTALLLGAIGLLVHRSIHRGFRPIEAINTQITRIGPATLEARVDLASSPTELATIVTALNGLLERIESGFARERKFSSDVAHELRTPVAELRAACEVGAKWPDDPAAIQNFFGDIREIALQMERIVTTLLMLTRCDAGTATVERKTVPLAGLVVQCWERMVEKAGKKGLRFRSRVDPAVTVKTDRDKLEMIVQNLLENAVAHSVPETLIDCECAFVDSRVDLTLANEAANLTPEDLRHVFDRFWQKDRARSAQDRFGLGLSIVKALADLLGIGLRVNLRESSRFEVCLSFSAENGRAASGLTRATIEGVPDGGREVARSV